jgi:hypothetical protein
METLIKDLNEQVERVRDLTLQLYAAQNACARAVSVLRSRCCCNSLPGPQTCTFCDEVEIILTGKVKEI